MKVLKTNSDIGSIRIYNDTMVLYLRNGIGDVPSKVIIVENNTRKEQELLSKELDQISLNMVASDLFEVKTVAYLSSYDCEEDPIYQFKPGVYHTTLYENATFLITWAKSREG